MDVLEQIKKQEADDRSRAFIYASNIWTEYTPQDDGSIRERDYIEWRKKGATNQDTVRAEVRIMPKFHPLEWAVLEPVYKAWKSKQEVPTDGTPFGAWPGASKELAKALERVGIRTVEDFCLMEDHALTKLNIPSLRGKQRECRMFRDALKSTAPLAAENVKLKEKCEYLEQELLELRALIETHVAAKSDADAMPLLKRGPGRPRKEEP